MLGLHVALLALASFGPRQDVPKFTPPPGEATAEERALLEKATKIVTDCPEITESFFTRPDCMPLHARTEFRELLRAHVRKHTIAITGPDEPGAALLVVGQVRAQDGTPVKNALVYVYQTSAKGWYSDKATHISGMEG